MRQMKQARIEQLKIESVIGPCPLEPPFSPEVHQYTVQLQSDIYGLRLLAEGEGKLQINGAPAAFLTPVVLPLSEEKADYAGLTYTILLEVEAEGKTSTTTITVHRRPTAEEKEFSFHTFSDPQTGLTLPYALHLPKDYDPKRAYPLLLVLHGAGQRTQELEMVLKRYECATVWVRDGAEGKEDMIVVAPQVTKAQGEGWTEFTKVFDQVSEADVYRLSPWGESAFHLLEEMEKTYAVDLRRVYATGVSMGGFGSFALAVAHPDHFAAIVPVCSGVDPKAAEALQETPVWMFHAADDPLVDVSYFHTSLQALQGAGVTVQATLYPAGQVFYPNGHFSWTPAYADGAMRDWLRAQRKAGKE